MRKYTSENISHSETARRQLGYSEEFKEFIHKNPGLIKTFEELSVTLQNVGDRLEKNGVEVELILITGIPRMGKPAKRHPIYKVNFNGQSYFVKDAQYREFRDSEKAGKMINDIPWARVIDFQLGYSDQNGKNYFVSKWENLPTLEDYYASQGSSVDSEEKSDLDNKIEQLKDVLGWGYFDVCDRNVFYDKSNKQLVLFDLNESEWLASLQRQYIRQNHSKI